MSILSDDLDVMLADTVFTVPVSIGSSSTRGWFDWKDTTAQDSSGFDVFIRQRTVTIRTGTLTGLVNGVAITVDGTSYRVHDINHDSDGNVTQVTLT